MSTVLQAVHGMTSWVVTLAQDPVPAQDQVRPGYIALGVMVLMCVATFLLWMNMRKQLGKIDFEEEPDRENEDEDDKASPSATGNGN
jgi:hypothetical protein